MTIDLALAIRGDKNVTTGVFIPGCVVAAQGFCVMNQCSGLALRTIVDCYDGFDSSVICCFNQERLKLQSRSTVAFATPRSSAVSSTVRPMK